MALLKLLEFLEKMSCNLFLLTFVLGIGGAFQYGLQVSIVNSPAEYIQSFIHETWLKRSGSSPSEEMITLLWSFVVSIYSIGGLLGSMSAGYVSVRFGRKKAMLFANFPTLLSAALMGFSRLCGSFEMIIAGRLLSGVCGGLALSINLMYAGECAPWKLRGMTAITASTAIALGKFVGFALGLREVLGVDALWPVLMATNAIPALVQLLTLPFFPDSPRYLLIDKKDKEGCMKAVKQLWGDGDHMAEIDDMVAEQEAIRGEKTKSLSDLFRDKGVRWQLITLFLVCSCMQLIGVNMVYFYAYNVFIEAGIPPAQTYYVSLGIGITEILSTILCDRSVFLSKSPPSLIQPRELQFPSVGWASDSPCGHFSVGLTAVGFVTMQKFPLCCPLWLSPASRASPAWAMLPAALHLPSFPCSLKILLSPPDAFTHPPRGGITTQSPALQRSPAWSVKAATGAGTTKALSVL
ncbi:solute carrier family 2, facilitated glucose transporter member 11-like isoform X3 [Heliangelus exortis]|uniref:solute carrier family 2, facilitated glucose transporter member 11-like isoform X3 n=1 Tax=Heliangelus exortis TaxID=472823 RepID=UPI003A9444B6